MNNNYIFLYFKILIFIVRNKIHLFERSYIKIYKTRRDHMMWEIYQWRGTMSDQEEGKTSYSMGILKLAMAMTDM